MDDKIDDVMLPGFRFHPTDEELVGFYLKRKIQQRPLPIELIKQVDIYKYDPWDLPKLGGTTGEKEWYFYCPRDRKYRNSARPNRVTGAGFWKATGTDRPIYSSDGTKCIGLKKSLVFYRGRAAKGLKTDWMMHEFRLPTAPHPSPPNKFLDNSFPLNDSWAICRIFKKTSSMANRAFAHPWVNNNVLSEAPEAFNHFSSITQTGSTLQLCTDNDLHQPSNFSALNIPTYKPSLISNPTTPHHLPCDFMLPATDKITSFHAAPSMLFNTPPTLLSHLDNTSNTIDFEDSPHLNNFSSQEIQRSMSMEDDDDDDEVGLGNIRSMGFPFSLPSQPYMEA